MNFAAFIIVLVWCAGLFGWVWNIVKLVSMDFTGAITVELVLRAVGTVVVPLGSVMGYL